MTLTKAPSVPQRLLKAATLAGIALLALAALTLLHTTPLVEAQSTQSSNANLSNLTVSVHVSPDTIGTTKALVPSFSATTTSYTTSSVNSFVTHVKLTPTVADTGKATVKVGKSGNLSTVTSGAAGDAIELAVGANDILAEVTAEDGTTKTYTVTVTRDQITTVWSATLTVKSLGNNLLGCSSGHDAATSCREQEVLSDDSFWHIDATYISTEYEVRPLYRSETLGRLIFDVHPEPSQDFVNHGTLHVGDQTFALADAKLNDHFRWFYWTASALSWSAGDKVALKLTLGAQSSNANLSALTVSDGSNDVPLTPAFASDTTGYTASVDNSVSSVTVTPTANDVNATVTVEGSGVASGTTSSDIALAAGTPKAINVVVTAQDGTSRTYTVTVTRASPSAQEMSVAFYIKQGVRSDGSGGSLVSASGLTISEGLSITYFVKLLTQPSANVTVAPASSSSAIWVNTGYDGPLTFTPENWDRVQSVQVFTYSGAAADENAGNITHTVSSDDSSYGGLTTSFTLDIVGTSSACTGSAAPTLTVDDSNRWMSISPSAASCGSTPIVGYDTAIKKDDGPWEFRSNSRWAVPASSTYSVSPVVNTYEVFSGSTYQVKTRGLTYNKGVSPWSPVSTITVAGVKASDADLRFLFISPGDLQFDADTTEYTVNVLQSVTSVTVSPLTSDYRATLSVDGVRPGPEYGVQVSLVEGEDKAIPVVVTAEDGVTTKTYTITVVQVSAPAEGDQDSPGEDSNNTGPGGL